MDRWPKEPFGSILFLDLPRKLVLEIVSRYPREWTRLHLFGNKFQRNAHRQDLFGIQVDRTFVEQLFDFRRDKRSTTLSPMILCIENTRHFPLDAFSARHYRILVIWIVNQSVCYFRPSLWIEAQIQLKPGRHQTLLQENRQTQECRYFKGRRPWDLWRVCAIRMRMYLALRHHLPADVWFLLLTFFQWSLRTYL